VDGTAAAELFDLAAQAWRRLPHLSVGTRYSVTGAGRFVAPTSRAVLIRFLNDRLDQVGFQVDIALTGTVE